MALTVVVTVDNDLFLLWLLAILASCFVKYSFSYFAYLKIWLYVFLLMNSKSALHNLNTSPFLKILQIGFLLACLFIFLKKIIEVYWLRTFYTFQMYNIIIWYLSVLFCAHHQKSNFHSLTYEPEYMIPFSHFALLLILFLCGNAHSVVSISVFVCFNFTCEWNHCFLSFSLWHISLSIIPSGSIHFFTSGKVSSFLWQSSISLYVNIPHVFPFIRQWTLGLFSWLGYCE